MASNSRKFREGDKVRVISGCFTGRIGKIKDYVSGDYYSKGYYIVDGYTDSSFTKKDLEHMQLYSNNLALYPEGDYSQYRQITEAELDEIKEGDSTVDLILRPDLTAKIIKDVGADFYGYAGTKICIQRKYKNSFGKYDGNSSIRIDLLSKYGDYADYRYCSISCIYIKDPTLTASHSSGSTLKEIITNSSRSVSSPFLGTTVGRPKRPLFQTQNFSPWKF